MDTDLQYRSGGEPARLPALWFDKVRIAWWPAGYEPTQDRVENVFRAWIDKGEVLGRDEVLAVIRGS